MWLDNKYTKIYNDIVTRAQKRLITGYVERHHIIPRSLGGSNSKDNLVALTAREHFICHLLLRKMTNGINRKKMTLAVFKMLGKGKRQTTYNKINSKTYQLIKIDLSKIVSSQKKGCKQPPRTLETRKKLSESKTGKCNPGFIGYFITPWGTFESSRLAAKHCPVQISAPNVAKLCRNNSLTISFLSVCRSKEFLNKTHVGKTPLELGFSFKRQE